MVKRNFLESYQFKNGATIKNRIVMAPMTTQSSFFDGQITTDELNYYERRSGGPGMIVSSCANVSESGKMFEGGLSVSNDRYIKGLKLLAANMKYNETKAVLQIFHAGRMTSSKVLGGEQPVSASAVPPLRPEAETPRALTTEEIEQIINDFGEATRRAIEAGFDGVELQGGNTFLIQQFYSPHSNRRQDEWGGTRDKRLLFPLKIVEKVKSVIERFATRPFILGYRLSPEEVEEPGIRLNDTLHLIGYLKQAGIDYLHISMGSVWRTSLVAQTSEEPLIDPILAVTKDLPVIGVGSIETPEDAEKVINHGLAFAAMARELIREPQWVQKVEQGDEVSIHYKLSPTEMKQLAIPLAMQSYLRQNFQKVMHFTDEAEVVKGFERKRSPME